MSSNTISQALEEVQKAYKIVFEFNTVLQDMLRGFFNEFEGFDYYYRGVNAHPKSSSPLDFPARWAIPANCFSVLYTRSKEDRPYLCLEKGDALVSCEVMINESLVSRDKETSNRQPFMYAAVCAATEDVPHEALENPEDNNWYYNIWNRTSYSEHGTSKQIDQKTWIKMYTEIILLESMYDAESIKAVAGAFKERAQLKLGITL